MRYNPWSQGGKTPFGRGKRTTFSPYKDKTAMVQKILGKTTSISKETKGKKEETRVAVGAPAYRRAMERRTAASMKV